jgi:hypothetical protein
LLRHEERRHEASHDEESNHEDSHHGKWHHVAKMINAFGAPINQADAKTIADCLKANYGQ